MTTELHKKRILGLGLVCAMTICLVFSQRHGPHREPFSFALLALALASTWLQYQDRSKGQADNLIHLFPLTAETSKERS